MDDRATRIGPGDGSEDSPRSSTSLNPITQVGDKRVLRVMQIFWVSEAALIAGAGLSLVIGSPRGAVIAMAAAAVLFLVPLALKRKHLDFAISALLIVQLATVTALAWSAQGLRDEAMLGYPGILIFAALIGSRGFFLWIVAGVSCCIAALGLAAEFGWHRFVHADSGLLSALIILIIIATISFGIWLLSGDITRLLQRLTRENDRYRESQRALEHMAHHDALTGLPNRVLARIRFEQAFAQSRRTGHDLGVLFLDLDHFKHINDAQGHAVGDQVLTEVGRRLAGLLRDADTVCRLGGDEFLILLTDLGSDLRATRIAKRIADALAAPVEIGGQVFRVTGSIGIALAPLDGDDFDTLLKHADMAMYQAKDIGRDGFAYFDEALNRATQRQLELMAEMRVGLERGEFELLYQPRIRIADGAVVGAEALIRWNHPRRGQLSPDAFIAIAERSNLIHDLGQWTLDRACRDCARWQQPSGVPVPVSVNVSVQQFNRPGFERLVEAALRAAGLPGAWLEAEITESLLIDDDQRFGEVLSRVRALGVAISIDDFGTGYSNLGVLHRHDFATLKIDRSFVAEMLTHDGSRTIVQTIVSLARELGLEVVAEGVETQAHARELAGMECGYAQGFLWARPLPLATFEEYLASHRPRQQALSAG